MTDKKEFEEEALAEFLDMTGIPKERVDQYGEIRRVEFQAYGETYELKNPGLVVIFKTFSDGFLPVLYFPKKHQDCSEIPTGSTTKNCRTCRNQGSHNGVCDICKKYSCWTEIESTNKNDCCEQMDFPDTFDEFAKDYGFKDKDEVYTNGSELIPVFRVKQWLEHISSVTPQEPKCKDCKWWKDSDGEYRRGCVTESICHINTDKVYQGEGYCYMFESRESEGES